MHSIPIVMSWEMWRRGRWYLLAAMLIGIGFPALIISLLKQQGGFDPNHESSIVLHFCFTQVYMFTLGAAVFFAQNRPSRLYTYPLSSAAIVIAHFIPGMVAMAIGSMVFTLILNGIFQLGWPIWGPALYFPVALAVMYGALWLAENSGWLLITFTAAFSVLGLWNKARYGDAFSLPDHLWLEVTPLEITTLLGFLLCAYAIAVCGVSMNRRSEPLPSIGILALIEYVCDAIVELKRPLKTAAQAQLWYEWRQKGWALPIVVVFTMVVLGSFWLIHNRDVNALYPALIAGGGLLTAGAIVTGVSAGHMGGNDLNYTMGSFLATRPLTSAHMARIILKMIAQSILLTWSIWFCVFLAVRLSMFVTAFELRPDNGVEVDWWYYPATLLGPWTVAGIIASIGLTGRTAMFVKIFCGLVTVCLLAAIFGRFVLTEEDVVRISIGLTAGCGVIFLTATVWGFIAAMRRSLVELPIVYVAAAVWSTASVITALIWQPAFAADVSQYAFVIGAYALAAAPFAFAPLALAWNRCR